MPTYDQLKFTFPGQSALLGGLRKSKFEGRSSISRKGSSCDRYSIMYMTAFVVVISVTITMTAINNDF